MPDILTGREELELAEAISAMKDASSRLDPVEDAAAIAGLLLRITALEQTIDGEIPSPQLCPTCNDPELLAPLKCPTSGHVTDRNGKALIQPAYLDMGAI